ncbi:MAG: TetR/AcrR family transcriptional regulator, partial [Brevefilum sp.]
GEFAVNPYRSASISSIVKKADIAKGSFYQYFEDKKAFYRYLVAYATDEKLTIIKALPSPNSSSDIFGYIRWQFLAQVYFELHRPQLAQLLFRAFIEEIPFPDMTEELRRKGTTQFFKQLLTQGMVHGSVSPWVDPDVAAFVTEAVFYQFGRYFIHRLQLTVDVFTEQSIMENQEVQDLLNNLMDILEAGIKRDPHLRNNLFVQEDCNR